MIRSGSTDVTGLFRHMPFSLLATGLTLNRAELQHSELHWVLKSRTDPKSLQVMPGTAAWYCKCTNYLCETKKTLLNCILVHSQA